MPNFNKHRTRTDARNTRDSYAPKKKSGAKLYNHIDSDKGLFIGVWKVTDGVMWRGKIIMSAKNKAKGISISKKSSKEWAPVTLVLDAPLKETVITNGLMNVGNSKVYFKHWNMMCNPNAANGGYFGKHISKN